LSAITICHLYQSSCVSPKTLIFFLKKNFCLCLHPILLSCCCWQGIRSQNPLREFERTETTYSRTWVVSFMISWNPLY
jgi:hypothetical protein